MYFAVTHGWGTDPNKLLTTEYWKYDAARKAMRYLFDMYQTQLETGTGPSGVFTCILKAKGVSDNGTNKKAETK